MRNRIGWILGLACVLILSDAAPVRAQVAGKDDDDPKAIKALVEESVGW